MVGHTLLLVMSQQLIYVEVCTHLVLGNSSSKIVIPLTKAKKSKFDGNINIELVWHWFVKIRFILSYVLFKPAG